MTKYILSLLFLVVAGVAPAMARPICNVEIIEQEQKAEVSVISGSTIRVTEAAGQTLYVYNVAGVVVQSFRVDGQDRHYDLNLPKGCYIVKVGKTVRKISVK